MTGSPDRTCIFLLNDDVVIDESGGNYVLGQKREQ